MDEILQKKLESFLKWCNKNGIQSPKAELRYCGENAGFGFFAKENLRPNESVVMVPKNMMITSTMIVNIPEYYQLLSSNIAIKLEPFEVIVLFFYIEHTKGKKSSWKPYISMLPGTFYTPLALGIELDAALLPPQARDLYEKQIIEVKNISSKLEKLIPDFDYSTFIWAWHVVNTRCIFYDNNANKNDLIDASQGDTLAVIPLMDMLNHESIPNTQPGFDKYSQIYRVTVGDRVVMEDDQLFVCYGPHDNCKLWVEYGFRLPNNLFNHVPLSLDLILAICSKIKVSPKHSNIEAAKEANFSCTLYGSEEQISYGLRKTCILLLMKPAEISKWQRIIYDEDFLEENSAMLDEANGLALKIIKEVYSRIQSKMEKITDENIASLYSDQLNVLNSIILSNNKSTVG